MSTQLTQAEQESLNQSLYLTAALFEAQAVIVIPVYTNQDEKDEVFAPVLYTGLDEKSVDRLLISAGNIGRANQPYTPVN